MKKKLLAIFLAATIIAAALPIVPSANISGVGTVGMTFCNFSSFADSYTTNGVNTAADRLEEIEDVLAEGYVNQLFVTIDENLEDVLDLCEEYDCDFWISPGDFHSDKQSIENYMANTEVKVNRIIAAGAFDRFLGFWWDEPMWAKKMTNEDLYTMTKALYEKWGKRNYTVFAMGAIVDGYSNDCDTIAPEYTTYITDAGWDNYGYDVRDSALDDASQNAIFAAANEKYGTNITTAEGYYRWIHSEMMEKFNHDVYVWFYPCAYITNTQTGTSDEAYCLAQLNFFNDLLSEQTKKGGLTLFTYASWSTAGIEQFLPVNNIATATQKLFPDVPKWNSYAARIKELKTAYDAQTASSLSGIPFGHIDITNIDNDSISFRPVSGYEYSINGGAFQTTGEFSSLAAKTEYTIRVKRTSDGAFKDFAVSTTAHKPYASSIADTASYAIKMPDNIDVYSSKYGWVSAALSRNADDTDFYGDNNGYMFLRTIGGERFIEVKNNNADGNANINLAFGDNGRATSEIGIDETVDTARLTAFAVRVKTTGGTDTQVSVFDLFINGRRTSSAASAPLKYLDKNTFETKTLSYNKGITITGNIDGWILVPFASYADLDGNTATTNLQWLTDNLSSIQIMLHEEGCTHGGAASSWDNKNWYIGDVMYVEDAQTFINARIKSISEQNEFEGYILNVPDEETYLTYNSGSINWGTRIFMKSGIDPFNVTDADYATGGPSGAYVRQDAGETFIILNPQEAPVSDTASANYGKIQESNGGIFYNAVNGVGKNTLGIDASINRSDLTHMAIRLKVKGGTADQYSSFSIALSDTIGFEKDLSGAYFIDYATNSVVDPNWTTKPFKFTGEFDGWLVVPLSAWGAGGRDYLLDNGNRLAFYFHTEMCPAGHGSDTESDWQNKTLYLGDTVVINDSDEFNARQLAPEVSITAANTSVSVNNLTDGAEYSIDGVNWQTTADFANLDYNKLYVVYAKWSAASANKAYGVATAYTGNYTTKLGDSASFVLDVPETEQYIAHNQGGAADGTYTNVWHSRLFMKSGLTDPTNGADSNYTASKGGVYVKSVNDETFLVLDPREVVVTDTTSANYGKIQESNGKVLFNNISSLETPALAGVTGIVDDIPSADVSHLAFRIKISGGEANQFSSFSIYMSTFGNLTGSYLIDKATGNIIESGWTNGHFSFTGEFDGWVVVPVTAWGLNKIEAETGFYFYFHTETCSHGNPTSNWQNKILYVGDVLAVEDTARFNSIHAK